MYLKFYILPLKDVVGFVESACKGEVVGAKEPHPVVNHIQVEFVQPLGDGGWDVACEVAKLSLQSVDFSLHVIGLEQGECEVLP